MPKDKKARAFSTNAIHMRKIWGECSPLLRQSLRNLTYGYGFLISEGDLQIINGRWYVTHSGLLRLAISKRCVGIKTIVQRQFCDPAAARWVFKAIVYKSNRALRKAYGTGLCSVEELGWEPKTYPGANQQNSSSGGTRNGHENGEVRLRDRLCLLIRQHQLDANLVKAYAADFCGTPNLRDASRGQIEQFVTNLSDWAAKDRPALLCKLNSYFPQEVTS
jgi:hypothetical protein